MPPDSGKGFIEELEAKMAEIGVGKIATVTGRYYAMDRDNRWDRVEKAYAAMVYGEGVHGTPVEVMKKSYADGVTDEFVVPAVTCEGGRVIRRATAWCSSTSARTARGRSPAPL